MEKIKKETKTESREITNLKEQVKKHEEILQAYIDCIEEYDINGEKKDGKTKKSKA